MIPLSAVHRIELRSSMVLKSPKIRIYVYVGQHGRPAPGMPAALLLTPCSPVALCLPRGAAVSA